MSKMIDPISSRGLLQDGSEFTCNVISLSPQFLTIDTMIEPQGDEKIILHTQSLNRLECRFESADAANKTTTLAIDCHDKRRALLVEQISWLNRSGVDAREHSRVAPKQPYIQIRVKSKTTTSLIKDISQNGVAVISDQEVNINDLVSVGGIPTRVVRLFPNGFGALFGSIQSERILDGGNAEGYFDRSERAA